MIKKAVIPAAGYGTRMLPITKAQPKEMMPVVHKPVIQYVVEEAYHSGIKEILIITGKHKRAVEDHFDRGDAPKKDSFTEELDRILDEISIFFIRQKEQKGLGDAVRYAEAFVDDSPFVLMLGDNITTPPCTEELISTFRKYNSDIIALEILPEHRIPFHGIIKGREVEKDVYRIEDLIEKPDIEHAPSNIGTLGRYILSPELFDYIKKLKPGYGGEIQLTDALRKMAKDREIFGRIYRGRRYDIGNKIEWLKANVELALEDRYFRDFEKWLEVKMREML